MKRMLSFLLALLLVFSCLPALSAGAEISLREKTLDISGLTVYVSAKSAKQMDVEIPEGVEETEDGMLPLGNAETLLPDADLHIRDISPDGSTYFLMAGLTPLILRDNRLIAIAPAYYRGAEDTYGVLKKFSDYKAIWNRWTDGLAWSPDGRYAAFTNGREAFQSYQSMYQLFLIDMQTGEMFLGETWENTSPKKGGLGFVVAACFDESGEYLYYFRYGNNDGSPNAFRRYHLATGRTERLTANEANHYPPVMFRRADGSFLSIDVPHSYSNATSLSIYKEFMGSWWLQSAIPHASRISHSPFRMEYSREKDAVLMLINNRSSTSYQDAFGMLRLITLSDSSLANDNFILLPLGSRTAEILQTNNIEDTLESTMSAEKKSLSDLYKVIENAALSPDGKNALLLTRSQPDPNSRALELLNLETMAVQTVSTPDGIELMKTGYVTPLSQSLPAGIRWLENGEILISGGGLRTFTPGSPSPSADFLKGLFSRK